MTSLLDRLEGRNEDLSPINETALSDFQGYDFLDQDVKPPKELTLAVKQSVEIDTNCIVYKVARLLSKNMPEGTILKMFSLSDDELDAIKQDENFELYQNESYTREHVRPVTIDDKWDIVEEIAVDNALDFMVKHQDMLSPDDALKYAGIANRALRKKTKIQTEDEDKNNQANNLSVTMNFTNDFMDKLKRLDPTKEHQRVASKSGEHKMVDFMPPREMEKVIEQNVTAKIDDVKNALDAVDDIDLVVDDSL